MSMSNNKHFSRHCIQHSRFTKQDGWLLWDLSLSLDGNIAITCCNEKTKQTSIDVYSVRNSDSRDKPKIFYSKEFEKYESEGKICRGRRVSFVEPDVNGDNIGLVTGIGDNVQVIDLIQDRVLKSRKVTLVNHGGINCLSVKERREIFIGFRRSNKVTVYDVIDLNEIKSIILQGIQDGYWPYDMTAIADRIFVCVGYPSEESNQRPLIFEQKNGRILSELTKPTDTHWYTQSITVSVTLGVVAVVWCDSYYRREGIRYQILFYSLLSENISSFLIVEIESGVNSIRISDRGDRMVTRNVWTGEVKVYDMAEVFTYSHFKEKLASTLQTDDCTRLANLLKIPMDQTDAILSSNTPSKNLLLALEGKGVLQPYNVDRLTKAFAELEINSFCYHVAEIYQKTRGQQSSQGQAISSLPGPSICPLTEYLANSAGKRAFLEGDYSADDNELHGKRAKAGERESGTNFLMGATDHRIGENSNPIQNQLITQRHQAPLMERDSHSNHTNFNINTPVTSVMRSAVLPLGATHVGSLPSPMAAGPNVSHQSLINTTGLEMSGLQFGSLGTQQLGDVLGVLRGEVQSQTNLQVGSAAGRETAQQGYIALPSQQHQIQTRQPIIPQILPQSGYSVAPVFRQPIPPPQLQPIGQLITPQRRECGEQTAPTPTYQHGGRSQEQLAASHLSRQNVGRQETQPAAQSFTPAMTQPVSHSRGGNADDLGSTTMLLNPHQEGPERNRLVEQTDFNAQCNIHQRIQLEQSNNLSHERQATARSVEQQQSAIQPGTVCSINQTLRAEGESAATASQGMSEEIKTALESSVQKIVTPLLKDISDKLGHFISSSKTIYPGQDIPGTSSQSGSNVSNSAANSRHSPDPEVESAWESLSEYNRMSLQAFRDMTDDRAELVRRLVEMVFTEEERHNQNCFGKSGKQKLDEARLRKIRHITFYLCPIITKKTDCDKLSLEDVEWKRLCEVIDKANRHFREKIKRQENRR